MLLIRDPREVVASYIKSRADGRARRHRAAAAGALYDELSAAGEPPLVIDSADFLDHRSRTCASCAGGRVSVHRPMLRWPPGPRDSDGVWAPHWYAAVERSTGFERRDRDPVELHGAAAEVARACRPAYEHLHALRWTP